MTLPTHLGGLLDAQAYPHPVREISLRETHLSWVLLTGQFAYKLKRPVHYRFVDLRSAAHRAHLCREELRLNRRFAPQLYLDVCAVTADERGARICGAGPVIDHAVKMRQFPASLELQNLLQTDALSDELTVFGHSLARLHASLPVAEATLASAQAEQHCALLLGNLEECAAALHAVGWNASQLQALQPLVAQLSARAGPWRAQRLTAGRIRECHGDLHCGNIVRWHGRLVAFDCLEFDAALRWLDVADEVAFLVTDLDARGYPGHAWTFLQAYLEESGDYEACRFLSLYRVHRALVRAKVVALTAAESDDCHGRSEDALRCARYVACAARNAAGKAPPTLILMHGLSGSGKSWLARRLAPALSAVLMRSDIERKRLCPVPSASGVSAAEIRYSPEGIAEVYRRLEAYADAALQGGLDVIVDATFLARAERERFQALAAPRRARVVLIDCIASEQLLRERLQRRAAQGEDPSEADVHVLHLQRQSQEPLADDEAFDLIRVDSAHAQALQQIIEYVSKRRASWCSDADHESDLVPP